MPTLQFTNAQMQRPVLADRPRLDKDLLEHLADVKPELFRAYPLPYLQWVAHDTVDLAAPFDLQDVFALRVFLRLRFEVAPGFFRQPQIAATLGDRTLAPMKRWERLSMPPFGDAWLEARQFDGAGEWRARYWGVAA